MRSHLDRPDWLKRLILVLLTGVGVGITASACFGVRPVAVGFVVVTLAFSAYLMVPEIVRGRRR